ncbi:hypothetical protein [Planctobacterium marinum]|uniref:Uncharacterized protein n=1 Tax=Planctobacterium marinum TaxID=1631968 RepID=A0AA48HXG6_9ALTE|nr:hypothetical protein MACH26_19210 [Planctobacterium marinum]
MKEFFDIHVVLATSEDMDIFDDEQAEEAAEQLNTILHMLYDKADEDTSVEKLENMVQHVWDNWREDGDLLSIDLQDLSDWVDQLLATWDDAHI